MIVKNNESVQYANKNEIFRELKKAVQNREIQNKHSENIKDMLGTDRIFD